MADGDGGADAPVDGQMYRLYFDPRSAPVVFRQPQFVRNQYKVAVVGARRVGKTALFNRLCYDAFVPDHQQNNAQMSTSLTPSMAMVHSSMSFASDSVTSSQTSSSSAASSSASAELMARSMSEMEPSTTIEHMNLTLRDGTRLNVDVVDVHGAPELPHVLTLRDCSGIVLVYAVDDARSWAHIDAMMRQLKHACPPDCDVLIIGNKCDRLMHNGAPIERAVPLATVDKYSVSHGCSFYECSSQTDTMCTMRSRSCCKSCAKSNQSVNMNNWTASIRSFGTATVD